MLFLQSIPSEVNFTFTKEGLLTETKVGDRVKFTMEIIYPVGYHDMLIELFSPNNDTTVMILCNVVVRHVGTNLSPSVGTPVVIMDSGENDNITRVSIGFRSYINFTIVIYVIVYSASSCASHPVGLHRFFFANLMVYFFNMCIID